MRRLIFTAAATLALIGAGIAVAHEGQSKSVKQVSATFTATTAGNVHTATCTGSDGAYATTHGEWTGTATSSEPTLNGNATIDADALVNTTTGDGTVSGRIRIDTSDGHHTSAAFDGVVDKNGNLAGFAEGRNADQGAKVIGNLSATWSSTGGFSNGKLGGGTSGGNAVLVGQGGCQPQRTQPATTEVRGQVSAVSSSSITVNGTTCTVPSTLASAVGSITTGDYVDIKCDFANGAYTLDKVQAGHGPDHHSPEHHSKKH